MRRYLSKENNVILLFLPILSTKALFTLSFSAKHLFHGSENNLHNNLLKDTQLREGDRGRKGREKSTARGGI